MNHGRSHSPQQQAVCDKCIYPSGTFVEFPVEDVDSSIPARFEKIVRLYPDRIAIKMGDRTLAYKELNRTANRIARAILAKRGPGAEPIALLFEHGVDVIATIFGILKAGKFYVVIDPSFPVERISYILEDSGAGLIATNSHNLALANELKNHTRMLLNIDEISDSASPDNVGLSVSPDDLVTICYTSGSTGKPKGVIEAHRSVLHRVKLFIERESICVDDRLTLLHPLSFASGHAHLRVSLLNGASLFPFDIKSEGIDRLARWLGTEGITIYHSPPSLFRQLGESLTGHEKLSNIRLIHLTGAPVTRLDFDLYKNCFGPETLLKFGMGSTEARGICSAIVDQTFSFPEKGTPIGYPDPYNKILLLDDNGSAVGPNEVGEIAVKGRNLNPGYWQRADLTQAKFRSDPTGGDERTYLTGDLGRMLPDGFLIHLGRKDLIVKIRGYRVELAEIEKLLLAHPQVKDAGVVAWDHEPGEKYLTAYVVPRHNPPPTINQLNDFLMTKLPQYMIPSAFMFLDSFPLTNGKLDRTALPKPGGKRPDLSQPYGAPRSEVERGLVRIWEEVLDVRPIGIHDNFLDLGGHSLAATRVVSRVTKHFQLELPLRSLFQSPTVAHMATIILGELTAEQRIELESRLLQKITLPSNSAIPRRDTFSPYPLSFGQERLWFLNQLEPESPVYNESSARRLIGALDVSALEKTFNCVIARHEVLRTTIALVDGNPMQRIATCRTIELPVIDLRSHFDKHRDTEVQRLIDEAKRRPFDLSSDLMLRTLLLQLDHQEHILLVVKHHVATDGWSSELFWHEVATLYAAFSSGQTANLPELPVQYADYAGWQRERLQGEVLESQLSYWRKQLADVALLQLPTDRPRPAVESYRGEKQSFELSKELALKLKVLSRSHDATLYMTLLAAFQTLLFRYTGQDDIAVGSPIAGRTHDEIEGLVGFFANTLVLRADLSSGPTFRELLGRVRSVCLSAFSHQYLPFEKLVEELHPDRRLNQNPLFQVMFQLNSNSRKPLTLPGIRVEQIELDQPMSKFDLSLSMTDSEESMSGRIIYNTDLYDAATIERMVGHFQILLEGIVSNPNQRIGELPLLTALEKFQLLVEWNDTKTDYANEKCIHELFEAQVEKSPDAIALVFEDQKVTYRELNSRANQLAHYLQKLGVGPEVLVGLCVDRSIELVVGLLGILKAGGAYVPLDPGYPEDRREFILHDSHVSVLLTKIEVGEQSASRRDDGDPRSVVLDGSIKRVRLDRDRPVVEQESRENLTTHVQPSDLAYVIYTSGSTGTPKGVAIEHRQTGAFLSWVQSAFTQNELSGVLASTSICFDLSVFEIFAPLTSGGTVIVAQNALALSTLCNQTTVTLINTVPSAMNELLNLGAIPQSVRVINLAGEPLRTELVRRIYESSSVRKVRDLYGPSECTTYSTWTDGTPDGPQTIGRPIANTQVYLLDGGLNPVPIGIVGEIYIGGDGVARGYLNRPELTEEKFIANPFSDQPGARLYKTGDLARYLPDGNIVFLGRIDHQVKIRGYRIELGEIEATLGQHPSITESIVLAREDSPNDRRLVAYVVAAADPVPPVTELHSFLLHKLPDYMVPSAFVFLDSLPLTPNGKLDRKALPTPDHTRPDLEASFAAPRTPVEEMLANTWSEVLKLDKVGIHDNFFHLGGHSLLATRVVSRINHTFQIDLPLRRLFETPTIASLSDPVQASMAVEKDSRTVRSIVRVPRSKHIPLSFAQERLWFLDRLDPDSPTYNVPAAFRLSGDLNVNALEQSLNEVVRRHEGLRTVFATINGNPVQIILPSLAIALTPIDLSQRPETDREPALQSLLKNEALQPFDLSRGPLIRAQLLRLSPLDHVLAMNLHHIVSDGWSMGVLFRDVSALYRAYCAGEPNPLPELPIQYADYSVWQRAWLQGETLDHQLAYWKAKLDSLSTLQLPTDHPRPAMQTYRGSSQSAELSTQLSQALKGLSQREGVTLFMTLLAAFQTLLSRYCGQSDIAVGTPIAGRVRQEIEGLIGFFVNTLVLRTDLSNNPTFKELLRLVREMTLEAYTHQDLPFEKLVEELHPERNPSISPLFQVLFVFQNNADSTLDLAGLSAVPIRSASNIAKFDLSLTMSERDGALRTSLNYNTDLFDSSTIERMLGHFQVLLEGIVANPEQRIGALPLLTDAEKRQLLVEWNDTKTEYPKDKCIHQLFEEQVEKTPNAIALVFEDQRLTYRELNQRANQLAHYLTTKGAQSGTAVGVYLERSIELAIALLAVLKAGGVYVPVDPSYPMERATFIFQDVQVAFVVSTQALVSHLSFSGARAVTLDTELSTVDRADTPNPRIIVGPQSPAYILFTSGSTGTPKGVVLSHRALNNLISWQVHNFGHGLPARTLQFAPLGFDVSLQEMFSTWCAGGSLHIILNELRQDGSSLLKYIDKQSIERIFLPFVALQHFAEVAVSEDCAPPSLREIITAGEQLQLTKPLRQFLDRLENCRLTNQYGPTECHVVTEYRLKSPVQHEPDLPPIGRPIANTQIYILDQHLHPVPIGVAGELHIGGDGLARGYVNRPELTAEKFITNPFSNDPESRLYKTGDLACYLPDGNIEFLGRIDNQVKIRGFRIELSEIETVLAQHPAVHQTAVLAREDTPGDKRLVAYMVATERTTPSVHDLLNYLQLKLPDYMVPSAFVFLDSLPLTPNGKLDRKALPAPDQSRPELEDAFAAPTTPVEKILANIWADVLKLDKVGIHDNFFHLGGHSLLATQVVSRIRDAFKLDLSLRALFEAPTIHGLMQKLQDLQDKREIMQTAQITPAAREQYRVQRTNVPD